MHSVAGRAGATPERECRAGARGAGEPRSRDAQLCFPGNVGQWAIQSTLEHEHTGTAREDKVNKQLFS